MCNPATAFLHNIQQRWIWPPTSHSKTSKIATSRTRESEKTHAISCLSWWNSRVQIYLCHSVNLQHLATQIGNDMVRTANRDSIQHNHNDERMYILPTSFNYALQLLLTRPLRWYTFYYYNNTSWLDSEAKSNPVRVPKNSIGFELLLLSYSDFSTIQTSSCHLAPLLAHLISAFQIK